jgi:hypothetical protein
MRLIALQRRPVNVSSARDDDKVLWELKSLALGFETIDIFPLEKYLTMCIEVLKL